MRRISPLKKWVNSSRTSLEFTQCFILRDVPYAPPINNAPASILRCAPLPHVKPGTSFRSNQVSPLSETRYLLSRKPGTSFCPNQVPPLSETRYLLSSKPGIWFYVGEGVALARAGGRIGKSRGAHRQKQGCASAKAGVRRISALKKWVNSSHPFWSLSIS